MKHRKHLYLPQMLVATALVVVMPVAVVWGLRALGLLPSLWMGLVVAVALEAIVSVAGTAYWERRASGDLVFSELLLWEWLRRLRIERQLDHSVEMLDRVGSGEDKVKLLEQLAAAIEARDPFLDGHSRRVARYAEGTARTMRLRHPEVRRIRLAALVHDIGKLQVPTEILRKPGKLTKDEYERVKRHADDGATMVASLGDAELTAIVRHHHERFDGNGYPAGQAGDEIPLGARIVAVADTFDAITSMRPYRSGARHKRAIDTVTSAAGTQLDPAVVHAFLRYYSGRRATLLWALLAISPQRAIAWPSKRLAVSQRELAVAVAALIATAAVAVGTPAGLRTERPLAHVSPPTAVQAGQPLAGAARSSAARQHGRERPAGGAGRASARGPRAVAALAATPLATSVLASSVRHARTQAGAAPPVQQTAPAHPPPPQAPPPHARAVVTTSAATSLSTTSAVLNGSVSPQGSRTYYRFDYGNSSRFGSSTSTFVAGSDSLRHLEASRVSGLGPNTTYRFRMVAWNAAGTTYGKDHAFTTRGGAPLVTTGAATAITATAATLTASLNPRNEAATHYFDYGPTTRYGSRVPMNAVSARLARASIQSVRPDYSLSQRLSGLVPSSAYHFRIVARNSTGTSRGTDQKFVTLSSRPVVATAPPSSIGATEVTLYGTVNPEHQATSYHFEYGTSLTYGSQIPAVDAKAGSDYRNHTVAATVTGLQPNRTYHFRVAATNVTGTNHGTDQTVTTAPVTPPVDQPISATADAVSASEGQALTHIVVARFTDPDTAASASEYTATINWGDASPPLSATITGSGGSFTVTGSHMYSEEGSFRVTVNISDFDDPANTATAVGEATVNDAALHPMQSAPSTSPQSFDGPVASFTDDNSARVTVDEFAATINWGDGSPDGTGTISAHGTSYSVSARHNYVATGTFTISVHILDDGGSTADASAKLLIFGSLPGGSFVIGDGNAATGAAVTFWGAEWWKLNPLSGGPAPQAFKGFEDSTEPARCGQFWTTQLGSDTRPPALLPTYMVVIVSSTISRSGSTMTGDSPQLAVVRTNPGYQPDPGHPGTGTVVARMC